MGFSQVDVKVPDELYDKFSEMAPLFVVQEIPEKYIPKEVNIYIRKKLVEKQSKEQKSYWVL